MTSRWFRRSQGTNDGGHLGAARAALAATFLDMENRQSKVETGVQAAMELSSHTALESQWSAVRDSCYHATTAYLAAATDADEGIRHGRAEAVAKAQQLVSAAVDSIAEFEQRNGAQLQSATHEVAAISRRVEQARAAAHSAEQALAAAEAEHARYPSVERAAAALADARRGLSTLGEPGRHAAAAREAASQVAVAASSLQEALAAAPGRAEQARRSISSGRTRLEALRTRFAGLPPNRSALLREFVAASSEDLATNEKRSGQGIAVAHDLLEQARLAAAQGRPEEALDSAKKARGHIGEAEKLVDAVAERLTLLRDLRANPSEKERRVRFQLRDAQKLVVTRGAVDRWASVLDAQVDRIDRIVGQLNVPRPDFWAYSQALEHVSNFIAKTVSQIREDAYSDGR